MSSKKLPIPNHVKTLHSMKELSTGALIALLRKLGHIKYGISWSKRPGEREMLIKIRDLLGERGVGFDKRVTFPIKKEHLKESEKVYKFLTRDR